MNEDKLLILGRTDFRNESRRFGIKQRDRTRHTYVVGQTGMGKSTLILNLILQDLEAGRGLALMDPHGDLVERVLDLVPPHRINQVVYFSPADLEFPIGFNILEPSLTSQRHLVASGLVEVFKKIWIDSWGPRLEYVLRNAILALLEAGGNTLLGIQPMLTDASFRGEVLACVKDPVLRAFWAVEYELYPKVFRTETISPIQNKVGQFLAVPMVRNILGQVRSRFDLRDIMDSRGIFLANLSKGQLGEDNASLLGSLLVMRLFQAAMSRGNVAPENRKQFAVYIDEFQNFAAESFAGTLSEMRKYGLNVVLAHQYLAQLPERLRSAVFGNVGSIIAFRVGAEDGEYLEQEFEPLFLTQDLLSLPSYRVYVKLSIDGKTSDPFSAETLPPPTKSNGSAFKVIDQSRMRYATPRTVVEDKVNRWVKRNVLLEF